MLTKDQKAYIEANYMTASDTVIAKQLGVKPHIVQGYREHRGLTKRTKQNYNHKNTLCWTCRLVGVSCRKPVDGWVAVYTLLRAGKKWRIRGLSHPARLIPRIEERRSSFGRCENNTQATTRKAREQMVTPEILPIILITVSGVYSFRQIRKTIGRIKQVSRKIYRWWKGSRGHTNRNNEVKWTGHYRKTPKREQKVFASNA